MSYYPLALVILLAFAGGWVWRGAFDEARIAYRRRHRKPVRLADAVVRIRPDTTGFVHPVTSSSAPPSGQAQAYE